MHSDNGTTTSAESGLDDIGESDEEIVEIDSDSTESYKDFAATSTGSSDRWEDDYDDDSIDEPDPAVASDHYMNTSKVLDVTSQHESSIANLSAVLHSLEVGMESVDSTGRDGGDSKTEAPQNVDRSTSKFHGS